MWPTVARRATLREMPKCQLRSGQRAGAAPTRWRGGRDCSTGQPFTVDSLTRRAAAVVSGLPLRRMEKRPCAAVLTVRRQLGSTARQPESGSATGLSLRHWRISAAAARDRYRAVLVSSLIMRLKVGPIRPQPLRRSPSDDSCALNTRAAAGRRRANVSARSPQTGFHAARREARDGSYRSGER